MRTIWVCTTFTPPACHRLCTVAVISRAYANNLLTHHSAKDHDAIRDEARELLQQVQAKSLEYDPDRKVCNVRFFFLTSSGQCCASLHGSYTGAYIYLLLRFRDASPD